MTIRLHAEDVTIARKLMERGRVQVRIQTRSREQTVDETLTQERVEVERVPIGRVVDAAPPVREEDDTTIISVVEEVLVVERRLILKEEIRLRRVRKTQHHRETVTLREEEALIERLDASGREDTAVPPLASPTPPIKD